MPDEDSYGGIERFHFIVSLVVFNEMGSPSRHQHAHPTRNDSFRAAPTALKKRDVNDVRSTIQGYDPRQRPWFARANSSTARLSGIAEKRSQCSATGLAQQRSSSHSPGAHGSSSCGACSCSMDTSGDFSTHELSPDWGGATSPSSPQGCKHPIVR